MSVASVIGPAEVKWRLSASTPVKWVPESSKIVTSPPISWRLPKFVVSFAPSPNVIAWSPALKTASPATSMSVTSVIGPAEVKRRLSTSTPVRCVPESSKIVTSPPDSCRLPKFVVSFAPSPKMIAWSSASKTAAPETSIVVESVIGPAEVNWRLSTLTPLSSVEEFSKTMTAVPARFRLPKSTLSETPLSPSAIVEAASKAASPVTAIVAVDVLAIAPWVDVVTSVWPVCNSATITSSAALRRIAPLAASISDPSDIIRAPPPTAAVPSASAATSTAPPAEATRPPVPKVTSRSASRLTAPPPEKTSALTATFPLAWRFTLPVALALATFSLAVRSLAAPTLTSSSAVIPANPESTPPITRSPVFWINTPPEPPRASSLAISVSNFALTPGPPIPVAASSNSVSPHTSTAASSSESMIRPPVAVMETPPGVPPVPAATEPKATSPAALLIAMSPSLAFTDA